MENNGTEKLLELQDIKTYFFTDDGVVKAVDGVDIYINKGEILGLVGESGCGKSVTSLTTMQLVGPPGKTVEGKILFRGEDLRTLSEDEMTDIRGNDMAMIFQEPGTALNPVQKVGAQIAEVVRRHLGLDKEEAWERAVELLGDVKIPDAEQRANAYPHELSGGMAQRVMIAMALACDPLLLIADEPTTALDVTIQAQILRLVSDLRERTQTAVLLITHDLGIVADSCDRVAVMYAGRIVEQANTDDIFHNAKHPYTMGLLKSIPVIGQRTDKLDVIPGVVPSLIDLPAGCRFAPRCRQRVEHDMSICTEIDPELKTVSNEEGHLVRCWLYHDYDGHEAPY
ncbi:MAG: methionine ABC transporter ATP-binding protein [Chloroflexi bacterium]|nr:methionine ABC transporter ATP-binding protein [Chloroflexota bacterium]HCU80842.1 methionine ABC transporter ATP-binding protein [Chloroflexota bacterium]|tara:strand:- start:1850 stop:2872 length:1023 start_codon:yes stop_codon:yes gene_type:complete